MLQAEPGSLWVPRSPWYLRIDLLFGVVLIPPRKPCSAPHSAGIPLPGRDLHWDLYPLLRRTRARQEICIQSQRPYLCLEIQAWQVGRAQQLGRVLS